MLKTLWSYSQVKEEMQYENDREGKLGGGRRGEGG